MASKPDSCKTDNNIICSKRQMIMHLICLRLTLAIMRMPIDGVLFVALLYFPQILNGWRQ